jgi:hypothetical protein
MNMQVTTTSPAAPPPALPFGTITAKGLIYAGFATAIAGGAEAVRSAIKSRKQLRAEMAMLQRRNDVLEFQLGHLRDGGAIPAVEEAICEIAQIRNPSPDRKALIMHAPVIKDHLIPDAVLIEASPATPGAETDRPALDLVTAPIGAPARHRWTAAERNALAELLAERPSKRPGYKAIAAILSERFDHAFTERAVGDKARRMKAAAERKQGGAGKRRARARA